MVKFLLVKIWIGLVLFSFLFIDDFVILFLYEG